MPKQSSAAVPFDAHLTVPVPDQLRVAVAIAAAQKLTSMNAYVRSAVLTKLRADGVKIELRGSARRQ